MKKIVDKNCTTVMISILTSCSDHWTKSYSFGLLAKELIISSILISSLSISILTSAAAWFWFISGSTFEHKVFELKKGQFWGSFRFYYQNHILINKSLDEPRLDKLESNVMENVRSLSLKILSMCFADRNLSWLWEEFMNNIIKSLHQFSILI